MISRTRELAAGARPRPVGAAARIRVCHVMTADLWAGAEVQLATAASYLVERHDVELTAFLLNEGRLARELRRLGIPVTVVEERQNGPVRILAVLTRFLRDHAVDLVHTHRYKDTVLGTVAAKLAGVRRVIRTVHGLGEPMLGWDRAKAGAYEALDRAALWCFADRIIAVSDRMAETLKASGYRRTAVIPIHNGVDLRRITAVRPAPEVRRDLGVGPGVVLIGTAGRLSPVKGHAYLLRAAEQLLRRAPDVKFLIVGNGPLGCELLALARTLRVDGECLFVGDRADVYDLIGAMDVFVLPSLSEGIPMALLEAMALGRPVVATAVGGVPEIITHGESGLLVAPKDPSALASACLELALDRDRAQALAARGRWVVETDFSHERNGQALMAVYRNLAVASPGRGRDSDGRTRAPRASASRGSTASSAEVPAGRQ